MNKTKILWIAGLIIIAFFLLFPFFQMLSTSLKPPSEQFTIPVRYFPKTFTLKNYADAVRFSEFGRYFINSLVVSAVTMIVATIVSLFGAYGFTRLTFPGRKFLLIIILFPAHLQQLISIDFIYLIPSFNRRNLCSWKTET